MAETHHNDTMTHIVDGRAFPDDAGAGIDPLVDAPDREGLTGTAAPDAAFYETAPVRDQLTVPPDGRPSELQPQWRKDFPIDWPQDQYVARRDFAKFLGLTSFAFVVGQVWIGMQNVMRRRAGRPPIQRIAALADIPVGASLVFHYPDVHDPCLLIRPEADVLLAYSQSCTHLSCAVVPKLSEDRLDCPCHEGSFDLRSGRPIGGPPQRRLPKILVELRQDGVYAIGTEGRAV